MPPLHGPCSDRDLYSWHGRWPPWTFLVSGCLDLVCQAKQHGILLPISVQLGRHSRACGVVCTSLVCLSGWAWELVLGRFGVLAPLPPCVRALLSPSTLEERVWVAAAHRVVMDTLRIRLGLIRGLTLLSRHHSPSLSIVDEFKCG